MYECELKNTNGFENRNYMTRMHDNKVNNIAECNLIHHTVNHTKLTKTLNSYYSLILHVCMNNIKSKAKFKNFQIQLDIGFSSTIVMGRIVGKLNTKI